MHAVSFSERAYTLHLPTILYCVLVFDTAPRFFSSSRLLSSALLLPACPYFASMAAANCCKGRNCRHFLELLGGPAE